MSEEKTRDQGRYLVRFPDGMRDRLAEVAKANNRSMNAEIIARLAASLEGPQLATDVSLGREQTLNLMKAMADANEQVVEIGGGIRFHFTIIPEEYMHSDGRLAQKEAEAQAAEERTPKKR